MNRLHRGHLGRFLSLTREKFLGCCIQNRTVSPSNLQRTSSIGFIYSKYASFGRSFSTDGSQEFKFQRVQEISAIIKRKIEKNNVTKRLAQIEEATKNPDIWKDSNKAGKLFKEQSELKRLVSSLDQLDSSRQQYLQLIDFGKEDKEYLNEAESILNKSYEEALELEIGALLSNEGDSEGCFIEVQAGTGGKDSMDWATLLLSMYSKWGTRRGFQVETIDETFGEVGLRSGCIKVDGPFAFGWTKNETGVHRLIRISPFDSTGKRHTSFASVYVSPIVDSSVHMEIEKKDLKIDTYRSSGPGGQHVNTTDSAVRITHLPTGIVAKAQSERSQHRNKDLAMEILKSRLYQLEIKKRDKERQDARSVLGENTFGNQIRTYTLHPYQMVKDSRTGVECAQPESVLSGSDDLDKFLKASLVTLST